MKTVQEFKESLDGRRGFTYHEAFPFAYEWAEEANSSDSEIKWSWDCGLKLDYDGGIVSISSRFYPPHKNSLEYCKYCGSISIYIGEKELHKKEIEATTLDELKLIVELYVKGVELKIKSKIENIEF